MNDILQGQWRQLRGKIKEHWGNLTDDDLDRANGQYDQVVGILQERYGSDMVYRGGLRVITTLDLDLQNEAERVAREYIATVVEKHDVHNAAVVVLDAPTGEILTMKSTRRFSLASILILCTGPRSSTRYPASSPAVIS